LDEKLKLGIIANINKAEIKESVVDFIAKNIDSHDFIFSKRVYKFLEKLLSAKRLLKKVRYVSEDKFKNKIDYLLSFGGDGTMLYSAGVAVNANVPLIGVNFGKLGFLADISYSELEQILKNIQENNFKLEERILLNGEIFSPNKKRFLALNDIVIEKGGWSKIIEINTWVDKKFLTTYRSDGLIISTPTGSTGYSLSTGGPILLPDSNVIVLSPICPHTLTVRPVVIPYDSEILIEAKSFYETVMINCDGQYVFKIKPPVKIKIKKSEKCLRLVKKKKADYFQTLREKLMWGMDVRENFTK
jgi:NAD+ kinase